MEQCTESKNWLDVLRVANLPLNASRTEIKELFARHGMVESVMLLADKKTKPEAIGWISMFNGAKAIGALDKSLFGDREIRVQLMGFFCKENCTDGTHFL